MILCVNPNAAIDKTIVVKSFRLGEIHRPEQVIPTPGGKGCNVARGLKCLGESPVVTGWVGGFAGQFIEAGLRREAIGTAFVHTDFESRTCMSILDSESKVLTEIYENGAAVPEVLVTEFRDHFRTIVGNYTAVTFSGSLPPGVPKKIYSELIAIAREAGVQTFLDSSGMAFKLGLEIGKPHLIKPNASEFAELVGHAAETLADIAQAAMDISERYGTIVVVSLGAQGAIAAQQSQVVQVCPPRVAIKSAVGSGDCMLAGIAYGLTHQFALVDAIRYGVAAGTANAMTIGAGIFSQKDFDAVLAKITVVNYESGQPLIKGE